MSEYLGMYDSWDCGASQNARRVSSTRELNVAAFSLVVSSMPIIGLESFVGEATWI